MGTRDSVPGATAGISEPLQASGFAANRRAVMEEGEANARKDAPAADSDATGGVGTTSEPNGESAGHIHVMVRPYTCE